MARSYVPELQFDRFFTYGEMVDFVKSLAEACPDLCRLGSLGHSREGREIYVLTITDFGSGAPQDRPAYLIQGNIHATEVAGTHAALYTARQLLYDAAESDILKRVTFYIVPRVNPDGAELAALPVGSSSRFTVHDSPNSTTKRP